MKNPKTENKNTKDKNLESSEQKVKVTNDGPYQVCGKLPLLRQKVIADKDGIPDVWQEGEKIPCEEKYSLCRCGDSLCKPFCDGSHTNGFDGTEVATKEPYLKNAETVIGKDLILKDNKPLCSVTKFCHKCSGTRALTLKSENPECKEAIRQAGNCPSGRLVVCDKDTGAAIEPKFEKSVCLVQEAKPNTSGPIWLRGEITLESVDGSKYETRNRMTLCRCGKSENKPFCDGTHLKVGFVE